MKLPFRRRDRPGSSPDGTMTLTDHLRELRYRIIRCAVAVVLGAIIIIIFYDQVLEFLIRPYDRLCERKPQDFCGDEGATVNVLDPVEGLSTRLRVGMYGGLLLSLPVILWQVWRFVVPALHAKERKYAIPFVLSSVVLFLAGGTIAYLILERALEFLISWAGEDVDQVFQVSKYIQLVGIMMAAFGLGFLLPVLIVFLQLVGVITPQQLVGAWRYAIVAIFVMAAMITPSGDPVSLMALAGPLLFLYTLAVFIGWLFQRSGRTESPTSP